MKTKHAWKKTHEWDNRYLDDKKINKIMHRRMKVSHKEPPWVACPYCGEPL